MYPVLLFLTPLCFTNKNIKSQVKESRRPDMRNLRNKIMAMRIEVKKGLLKYSDWPWGENKKILPTQCVTQIMERKVMLKHAREWDVENFMNLC